MNKSVEFASTCRADRGERYHQRCGAAAPRGTNGVRLPKRLQSLRPLLTGSRKNPLMLSASETDTKQPSPSSNPPPEEFIEVTLTKPLGLRFCRGSDGGAYVTVNEAKLGATDSRIEVGDKVVQCSASFGEDIWDARNFGQVMFAIRTRNGEVYLKFKRMFGDVAMIEDTTSEEDRMWRKEQGGGNVGIGTKEKQRRNYIEKKQKEVDRLELFNKALKSFKKNNLQEALIDFENVVAMEPTKYMGDNFSRYTDVYPYAQYNVACCYSSMDQIDAGIEALESAFESGFDDYDKARSDPNLAKLRTDGRFKELVDKYDEPVINENAVRVLKNLFSFGKNED